MHTDHNYGAVQGTMGTPSMANHLRIQSIIDWDSDVYFMMKGIGRCCMLPSMANCLRIQSIIDWDSDVYFMMKGIGRCCMQTIVQHRASGVWTMEEQQKQLMLSQASRHSWNAILSNWLETFTVPFLHTEQNALHIWRQKLLNYACHGQ